MSNLKQLHIKKGKIFTKYNLRCNYCGYEKTTNLWQLILKRLLGKTKTYYVCPNCHKTNCYLFRFTITHDSTDKKEKENNKIRLWDDRLWLK